DRGLGGAGRSPKDERAQRSRIEQARERAVGPKQMVLADDLAELRRPQLVGERPRRIALEPGGREQARAGALGARRHPRSSTDSCLPPRTMVMLPRRLWWPVARSRSRVLPILALLTASTRSPRWKPMRCA